ncbi:unnamed protein product [Lactuca virosa]|uniref:Uncharacterized protein n=1 Tax=Lactuca virosa TaxID=75947 RepID=A0AAU9M8B2_9ASTR|nr:unnamed protein product [Lactuca virosa]
MNTYKIPNVHTKEKKEEIQSVIRELEFAMEFCIDSLVNDFDKLILFRDEMNEKMRKKEKVDILPPTLINNKGVRKTKKRTKGKKDIAVEKAKNDGRNRRRDN